MPKRGINLVGPEAELYPRPESKVLRGRGCCRRSTFQPARDRVPKPKTSTFLYFSLSYSTLSETSADGQDLEVSILGWSFCSVDYRTFEAHPVPERGRFMPCVVAVYLYGRRVVLLCALPGGSPESF